MHTLNVQNLRCGGCANTITKAIEKIEGVSEISVNIDLSTVSFKSNSDEILAQVKKNLSDIGYPVANSKNSFRHKTVSILSCVTGKMSKE